MENLWQNLNIIVKKNGDKIPLSFIWGYEIYYTIEWAKKLLKTYGRKYDYERIEQRLNHLTPMEYYYTLKENVAKS